MSIRALCWAIILIQCYGPVVGQPEESKGKIAIKLGIDPNRLYPSTVSKGASVEDAVALIGTGLIFHESVVLQRQKTVYLFEQRALKIGIDDLQLMEGDAVFILPSSIRWEELAQGGVNVILGPAAVAALKAQYPPSSSGIPPEIQQNGQPTEAPKNDPPPRPAEKRAQSLDSSSEESPASPHADKADASDRLRLPRDAAADQNRPRQALGVAGALVGMTVLFILSRRLRGRASSKE